MRLEVFFLELLGGFYRYYRLSLGLVYSKYVIKGIVI